MKKTLIFTTLPHHRQGDILKLSVSVSIRLEPNNETILATFPDMLNWPAKILGADFSFRFNNTDIPAQLVKTSINSELWQDLFYQSIKVRGYQQEDFQKYRLHSYPVKHVKEFITKSYARFAISNPTDLIKTNDLLKDEALMSISRYQPISDERFDELKRSNVRRKEEFTEAELFRLTRRQSQGKVNADGSPILPSDQKKYFPYSPSANPATDFQQLRSFHLVGQKGRTTPLKVIKKPDFEFHDIVSVLSSYPQVQRRLGLVLDFELNVTNTLAAEGGVQCLPQNLGLSNDTTVSCPKTAYRITNPGFYARAKDTDQVRNGFLAINSHHYNAYQMDADGVAIKLNNFVESKIIEDVKLKVVALNLLNSAAKKPDKITDQPAGDEGMPHIRSAGIAVGRNGLSEVLHLKFEQAQKLENTMLDKNKMSNTLQIILPEDLLYAEDITQGYRMDIAYSEKPDQWYSLHQKKDRLAYIDTENNAHTIDGIENDEGFVQLGVAEKNEIEGELFTAETLFRWEGWSLAVRKPGYAINESDDESADASKQKDYVNTSKQVEAKKYALDEDLEFKLEAEPQIVPGTLPRLRFGLAYMVRARIVDMAGNSVPLTAQSEDVQHTVIRSFRYLRYEPVVNPVLLLANNTRDGESLEHLVVRSNFDKTAAAYENDNKMPGQEFSPETTRHVVAPKNGQLMAETHGKFDDALGNNPAVAKEMYQLITANDSDFPGQADKTGTIHKGDQVELVYLPDPMAAGVSFYIDSTTNKTHSQTFDLKQLSFFENQEATGNTNINIPKETWYKAKSLRIRLQEGNNIKAEWKAAQRLLEISIPKGQRMQLRYSSWWRADDIERLSAVWQMVSKESPPNIATIRKYMNQGMHWMISPSRTVELIHAVQQPVEPSEIKIMQPQRAYNDVICYLNVRYLVHGYSTNRLDFHAQWKEIIDDVVKNRPEEVDRQGQIANIPVDYHAKEVTKASIAQTQPKDKIQQYQKANAENNTNALTAPVGHPPLEQRFQDTKHRLVRYKTIATTRYHDHFDQLIKTKKVPITREGPWFEDVIIPSSARPLAPEVDYIIPTFEWRKTEHGSTMQHHRVGGGLRIYLKRPWYSSGVGERLGVLFNGKSEGNFTNTIKALGKAGYNPFITQWGVDPIKLSQPESNLGPGENDFRFNPIIDKAIVYPGRENYRTDVAAFPVEFDEERNMYRADIALETGSMYFPFVRLALARYQQHSVRMGHTDVCLSPVVMPDFIQLVPSRKAKVDFRKDDQNSRFTITVEGPISLPLSPRNVIELAFFDPDVAQPVRMFIDDGTNDKKLEEEKVSIHITEKDIQNNHFKIERDFKLNRRYKDDPFLILIREFELPMTQSNQNVVAKDASPTSENQPRLVYADRFNINAQN
jgi:hypothetical protein